MARAFFRVTCSFGLCFNLGDDLRLPGVVGVDGGCDDVESPPAVTAAVAVSLVKGERVFDGDDRTISREDEAASRFFIASLYARRMAWRFARFELSANVKFLASIASGTLAPGHLIMKSTTAAMRLSTRLPLPDMLAKTFRQWESKICPQSTRYYRNNTVRWMFFGGFSTILVWRRVKLDGKTGAEHRGVTYQTSRKRLLYNAGYLLGA